MTAVPCPDCGSENVSGTGSDWENQCGDCGTIFDQVAVWNNQSQDTGTDQ